MARLCPFIGIEITFEGLTEFETADFSEFGIVGVVSDNSSLGFGDITDAFSEFFLD